MQHLKLLSCALLVTVCAFYVEGVPAFNKYARTTSGNNSKQLVSKGYFGYLNGTTTISSPQANKSPETTRTVSLPRTSNNSKQLVSKGYFGYLNGNTKTSSPKATTSPEIRNLPRTSSNSKQQLSKGYFGYLNSTTPTSSTQATTTASASSGGFMSKAGSGLASGVGLIGSGLSSGASLVGNGIATGVNGIVSGLGAGSQFTIDQLSNALSAVTPESLSKALKLGDLASKMDVTNVMSNLISGQANPFNGGLNFETATVVLEKFGGLVPGLGQSVKAIKTVSHVMQKIKSVQDGNGNLSPTKLMMEAADLYFKDVDPNFKRKLIDLAPLTAKAARGDTSAALQIASSLADRNTVLESLKGLGYKTQIDLVQNVVNQASDYAKMVKFTADATQKLRS